MQRLGEEAVRREKYAARAPVLNERSRRLWAAPEARALGRGGQTRLAKVMGLSRSTLHRGLQELAQGADHLAPLGGRVRSPGGGRKPLTYHQPLLPQALEALVEPTSRGEPQSPLRWTCKRVRQLAAELTAQGYDIGRQKVADLLHALGYSLQANRKSQEGGPHPDRNAQFRVHQRAGAGLSRAGATGGRGRREEERVGRRVQKWRARVVPPGRAGRRTRP